MPRLLVGLLFSALLFAGVTPVPLIFVSADPAGACSNGGPLRWNPLLGHEFGCVAGTWTNITGAGAAGGTVTSFSAGTLSPVFTTSVATATTTPALTFVLTNAGPGTVFGNRTGSAAAPAYTAAPVLGLPGTTIGTLGLAGNTSGTATITPQAAAGTPTLTLPSASGTFADGASAPLALSATTGNLTITGAAGAVLGGVTPAFTVTPTLGIAGTSTGTLSLTGVTSGTATITPQATAGSPTLTLPNANGTFAVSASSPVAVSATTGNVTCTTCATTTNGGAISGTAPVAVSAAGAVSVTGAAGAVLAGSAPAFTVTPTLGIPGTSTGTLSLTGVTSGTVLVTPQATAGSPTLTLPNTTGTLASTATSPLVLNATTGALTCPTCQTSATTVVHSFGATFDGSGSALTVGTKTYVTLPYACTIQAWNATVDTGTITFDIWKIATGSAIPTVSNTITASALPAISSGTALHSTTLTAWTTTVTANDIVAVNINAVATATRASLAVQCQ